MSLNYSALVKFLLDKGKKQNLNSEILPIKKSDIVLINEGINALSPRMKSTILGLFDANTPFEMKELATHEGVHYQTIVKSRENARFKLRRFFEINSIWSRIIKQNYITQFRDPLCIPIDEVYFSVRTFNILGKNRISYLGELSAQTEKDLLKLKGMGLKSLVEIKKILANHNLELKK